MAKPKIRPMSPNDLDAVAEIVDLNPLWHRYQFRAQEANVCFENAISQPNDRLLVSVNKKDTITGFAWFQPTGGLGRAGYLRLIGVHPKFQGKGFGKLLLQSAEECCQGRAMMLLVSEFNDRGIAFYEREGYERAGSLPGFVLPDVNEVIMWKRTQESQST